jgi:hypothetical protein
MHWMFVLAMAAVMTATVMTGASLMPTPVMSRRPTVTRARRGRRRAGQDSAGNAKNARNDETY